MAYVLNDHSSDDDKLRDYCDGSAYKTNNFFSGDGKTLQIQLYIDDFQVSNPLGNKIKKYKITAVYFLLGNLPPKYRSKLAVIQLAVLAKASLVKKYGLPRTLEFLMADLKSLESEGFAIHLPGGMQMHFRGSVSFVMADNLGAHEVSGMFESFVANRSCRFCTATRIGMQEYFAEDKFNLRTPESYNAAVSHVEEDATLASVYGIKKRSVLNSLANYHVCWGIPSDIGHDIFEGFGCDVLAFCVKYFVQNGYLTLIQFNDTVETFPYSDADKVNQPSRMSSDMATFRIKQTATQCWCLLRLCPLMIGHLIPEDDEVWQVFIQFLDIVDMVCAPTLDKGTVEYLRILITSFCETYFEINEDANVKPKAHYLIHYPTQIYRFGPLVHCWTLRFEGKHHYFKELVHRSKNRRNICKTMARRHQFLQCLCNTSEQFLEADAVEHVKGSATPVRLLLREIQELLSPLVGPDETVYQAKSVKYNGTEYTTGCCVVSGFAVDYYQFGRIESCYIIAGNVHLLLKKFHTEEFSSHFHAYVVSETDEFTLLQPKALLSYHQLGVYKVGEDMLIALKFFIDHGDED